MIHRYGQIYLTGLMPLPEASCFSVFNILVAPSSRGTVRLSSSSPLDPPLLDPAFFENLIDLQLLYGIARQTHNTIRKSSAVSKYGAVEYGIDEDIRDDLSDRAMRKRLLRTVETVFHGSGTCAMGTVVDTECRVEGVEGLRVIDTSVFPFPPGAHFQAIVYAVAEQVSPLGSQVAKILIFEKISVIIAYSCSFDIRSGEKELAS